jgi:hypothetical protein
MVGKVLVTALVGVALVALVPVGAAGDTGSLVTSQPSSSSVDPLPDAVTSFAGTAGLAAPLDLMNELAEGSSGSAVDPLPDAVTSFAGTAGLAAPLDLMNELAEGPSGSSVDPLPDAVTSFAGTAGLAAPLGLSNALAEGKTRSVAVQASNVSSTSSDGVPWSLVLVLSVSVAMGLAAASALYVRSRHGRTVTLSH